MPQYPRHPRGEDPHRRFAHSPRTPRNRAEARDARERALDDPRERERKRAFNQTEASSSKQSQRGTRRRLAIISGGAMVVAAVLIGRLGWVQLVWGPDLAARAEEQRTRVFVDSARRGAILDAKGNELAFTMQARSLTASPNVLRGELRTILTQKAPKSVDLNAMSEQERNDYLDTKVDEEIQRYAREIPAMIRDSGAQADDVDEKEVLEKLREDATYVVLVRNVDPDVAEEVADKFHGIAADMQSIREYPNGAVAENVLGKIGQDGQGQFGFEASSNNILAGQDGRETLDVSADGVTIPGSQRDAVPAQDGAQVKLTLDLDLQTYVQQQLEQAKANSRAKNASAVVLDVQTGKVMAMANTDTINPNGDIAQQLAQGKKFDNTTVSAPFEPGSVAKVITAAGVIEDRKSRPDEVLQVPGSISMSGVTVRDAWQHGDLPLTTTGVFGKSSNVGTLMLAQRLGEDRYNELLQRFGIGQPTGIELPSESQGLLPHRSQWSGGTFANLPIGQGMSWTLLQMAGVYQAIANGGERIEPRIIDEIQDSNGTTVEQPAPETVQVVSPQTARTVMDMFRAVVQQDPTGVQQGTGPGAAVEGYQVTGKTGTAQQVDPDTGAYSNSKYWITFAGIAPVEHPRFVVALMLDQPQRGVHGEGGQSAAPLFHDIAAWLLDKDNVPTSPPAKEQLVLEARQ